jgi:hypothetical protein
MNLKRALKKLVSFLHTRGDRNPYISLVHTGENRYPREGKGNPDINRADEKETGSRVEHGMDSKLQHGMDVELPTQLEQAQTRIQELERLIANSDQLVLRKEQELKQAVASYRTTLAKENPDILPELLSGETIEALDMSLAKAKQLTEKVKASLEEKAHEIHIPTGAPERSPLDVESLSSTEKIKEGINRIRRN